MEKKRQLEALTFHIKKRKKDNPDFDFELGNHLFINFPDFLFGLPDEDILKNSVKIEQKDFDGEIKSTIDFNSKENLLTGKISSTKYGDIFKVRNAKKKDSEPIFESSKDDGVERVYFFLMYFDTTKQKGMVLLERNGIYGIKSIFSYLLKEYFKDYFPDYSVKTSVFIDREIAKRVIKDGVAKSITLKTERLNSDSSEKLGIIPEESKDYYFELTIRKRKGYFGSNTRGVVKKLFNEKKKGYIISDSIKNLGFSEKSNLSVKFDYNSKDKNINFDESINSPRTVYDIYVETDKYGESDIDEITKIAKEKLELINPM